VLTPEEQKKYAAGWRKRRQADEHRLQEQHTTLLDRASRVASLMRERFGAEKIILFGSVATGRVWAHSDLDLAVLGLPQEQYLEAFWEASELARPFQLDLLLMESASVSLRRRLEQEGVEI
jgi:predicted nucleotidyltransferase